MARAVISTVRDYRVIDVDNKRYSKAKIIYDRPFRSVINETLPFRVKFINIGIPGYSPTDVPPIGIAIIGVNNYIL